MKKVIIGIIVVVAVVVASLVLLFSSLNKEKTPISADTFNSIMSQKGLVTSETTGLFAHLQNVMKKSYMAQGTGYQIEFYELSSEELAINMYNTNKQKFESQKTTGYVTSSKSGKNYSVYSLTTNGTYKYASRIANTFIYIDVAEEYKETVKEIMKEIGY